MMDPAKWKKIKEGNWECRPGPMVSDWDPYQNIPTTTAKGIEFIKARKESDQPFFLYFALASPHAPIIPNDEFDGKSMAGPYGDFVHETDHACGQLLKALKDSGHEKDTLVIFTADNGPDLGQRHNLIARHPEKAAELRARLARIRADGHSAPRLAK